MPHTKNHCSMQAAMFTLLFIFCSLSGWSADGLQVKIEKVSINSELKAEVQFTLKDAAGMPLRTEDLSRAVSFIIARLDKDPKTGTNRYVSYTTREQKVPAGNPNAGVTAIQAGFDSGGTVKALDSGRYLYTFKTALPAGFDQTKTHTVSAQIERIVGENRFVANPVYHFVPNGSKVEQLRKIVATETCNKCHTAMSFHGGARMEMTLCIMCHTNQTSDPDTGRSVDMTEMIHKIHMGAELPSNKAGNPYIIVGNRQSVHNYSGIHFPQDHRNCQACHVPDDPKAPHANMFKTSASRQTCGSCHDDVNFDTGAGHGPGFPAPEGTCAGCHPADGAEFGTSVAGAHTAPFKSAKLKGINAEIVDVINAVPGQTPTVRFTLKQDDGTVLDPAALVAAGGSVAITYAGPVAEYSTYTREAVPAADVVDGVYAYTFKKAIGADAKGSVAFAIEARRPVILADKPEGTPDLTYTEGAFNPVKVVSLDGTAPVQRRSSVKLENCNSCHDNLALHGGQRYAIEFCVMCHNPNVSDITRRGEGVTGGESVSMDYMIHKIHTGAELEHDYTVYGFGGTAHPFKELVHYPGMRNNCTSCHEAMPALPVSSEKKPVKFTDKGGQQVVIAPTTASCTSCHDSNDSIAHANVNTTMAGAESCSVCHKDGRNASIVEAHALKVSLHVDEVMAVNGTEINNWELFMQ